MKGLERFGAAGALVGGAGPFGMGPGLGGGSGMGIARAGYTGLNTRDPVN
jgi:hypothetical protein